MKVIFLDIDGVLIIQETRFRDFSKQCVEPLKRILQETGAKIVISSVWRKKHRFPILQEKFVKHGFNLDVIIGATPGSADGIRGKEILTWLKDNPVDKYIVIDDEDFDIKGYVDKIVKTMGLNIGLTEKDADKAIKILT